MAAPPLPDTPFPLHGPIWANVPWPPRHLWHSRQRDFCNLRMARKRLKFDPVSSSQAPLFLNEESDKCVSASEFDQIAYTPVDFELSLSSSKSGAIDLVPWIIDMPLSEGQQTFERITRSPGSALKMILRAG
jgi:hypothetical protein